MTRLRVIVWSTGTIGSIAIRAIRANPDLELVGVWVHDPNKVGRDAGELAGTTAIGVTATNDVDELIGLAPDCVVYAANGPMRDAAAIPDYVRLLAAGINVVATTSTRLIHPASYEPAQWRAELVEASQAGGASLYAGGIEPGFAADHLVLTLVTQSKAISSIVASEIALYDDYPVADVMMDGMGFGRPLDFTPLLATPGAIAFEWGAGLRVIADALGAEIQEVRESFDRVATDRAITTAFGVIEPGTCGALRTRAIAVVDGREAITIEHVNRLAADLAPQWPNADPQPCYRIAVAGEPDIACDLTVSLANPAESGAGAMSSGAGAMVATAMRVVNAIPYVVAADPGLLGCTDLPLTLPAHVFRQGRAER